MWTVPSPLGQLSKILSNRKEVHLSDYSPDQTPHPVHSQARAFNKWFWIKISIWFQCTGEKITCKIPGSMGWETLVADKGRIIRENIGTTEPLTKMGRWTRNISWAWMGWEWGWPKGKWGHRERNVRKKLPRENSQSALERSWQKNL